MIKNSKWLQILQFLNISVMVLLTILILSSFFLTYEDNWRYLPVFKFHIFEMDKQLEIFVHTYIFNFNLGFYIQLFTLIFSFMIYFSTKRTISFQMIYIILILRSALVLIQASTLPVNYINAKGFQNVQEIHFFYLSFFLLLFLMNLIFDSKKRPRTPEPFEIIKD